MILGTGLELVAVAPFEGALERTSEGTSKGTSEGGYVEPPSALLAPFTQNELAYCRQKRNGGEPLAARYAAKRAACKALGMVPEGENLAGFEVIRLPSGQPILAPQGPGLQRWKALQEPQLLLTLSHSGGFAVALVVAQEAPNPPTLKEKPHETVSGG